MILEVLSNNIGLLSWGSATTQTQQVLSEFGHFRVLGAICAWSGTASRDGVRIPIWCFLPIFAKGTVFGKSWICRKWRSAVQVLICPGLTGLTDVLHFWMARCWHCSYHVGKSRDEAADQVGGPIASASAGRHHGSLTEVAQAHAGTRTHKALWKLNHGIRSYCRHDRLPTQGCSDGVDHGHLGSFRSATAALREVQIRGNSGLLQHKTMVIYYTPGRLMDGISAKQRCFDESSEVHEGAARSWKDGIVGQWFP